MKKINRIAAAIMLSLLVVTYGFSDKAYAKEDVWDIENTLDTSECSQGDTIIMSVYLKGSGTSAPQDISSMRGTLEYDNSLFVVETADILPAESDKVLDQSFDKLSGVFDIKYSSDITVQDGGLMLQIRLHTTADASTGKTTLCVTGMEWSSSDSQQATTLEHRIPARIMIAEAESLVQAGDVDQNGKVNLTDVKIIMMYYNGERTLNSQQKGNADVNADGKVDLTDAKLIMKYYNGEITGF